MTGIDEKSHFYKSSERACCVKRKKINAEKAEAAFYARNANYAYAYVN
ncbi:MAG: hypothetical protein Fur009_0550 [Candidatus Microgenomates bacterium]